MHPELTSADAMLRRTTLVNDDGCGGDENVDAHSVYCEFVHARCAPTGMPVRRNVYVMRSI